MPNKKGIAYMERLRFGFSEAGVYRQKLSKQKKRVSLVYANEDL